MTLETYLEKFYEPILDNIGFLEAVSIASTSPQHADDSHHSKFAKYVIYTEKPEICFYVQNNDGEDLLYKCREGSDGYFYGFPLIRNPPGIVLSDFYFGIGKLKEEYE